MAKRCICARQLEDFYRISAPPPPERKDGKKEPEREPILSAEEQRERSWRPEARSPGSYDRANGAPRLASFYLTLVVNNPGLFPRY